MAGGVFLYTAFPAHADTDISDTTVRLVYGSFSVRLLPWAWLLFYPPRVPFTGPMRSGDRNSGLASSAHQTC